MNRSNVVLSLREKLTLSVKRAAIVGIGSCAVGSVFASGLAAQSGVREPRCDASTVRIELFDACNKLFDMFRFITPQIGAALGGGNVMPGENGTLGGPSKYSFSVRATAVDGFVPKNFDVTTDPLAPASNLGAQRAPIPMVSADVVAGVFQGFTYGLTNIGGVDLLLGLTYVPSVNKDAVNIDPAGSGIKASYGLRVGLLQESAAVPGVSISYRVRKLPTTSIAFSSGNDTLHVKDASIGTTSLRIVAGKHYKFVGVSGGFGRDQIKSKSFFTGVIRDGNTAIISSLPTAQYNVTRNNAFAGLSLGLPRAQLVGEIGWSRAGDIYETRNSFDGHKANDKYRYYSLGFSFRP